MMRYKIAILVAAAGTLFSWGSSPAFAQDEITSPPKPAARANPIPINTNNEQDQDSNQDQSSGLQPDTRPLTGIQTPTLGSQQFRHSYWVPGFQYANTIQSRSLAETNPSPSWSSDNYFAGNISLLSTWSRAQLALNYSGGGFLSNANGDGNGYYQELSVVQAFDWRRWKLRFLDHFSYVPEALFGFGGAIRLGVPGIAGSLAPPLPGFGANLVPNQSIFASTGTRYSNASAAEATYDMTPRSSITMAGSYGFLRFLAPGNIDSDEALANFGYDYILTRADTIGVFYRFTGFHFDGASQAIGSQTVNFAYGRKITGRLALQLSGGPEIVSYRVPVNGNTRQVLPYASVSLTYGVPRGQLSLGYTHGVSGGSGVLVGSHSDQITASGNRRIGRSWTLLGNLGYARNRGLAVTPPAESQSFGSWFATTGLTHPFGPDTSVSFGYTVRVQTSSQACVGICNTNFTQQQITLGFQWNTRPFVIR